MDLRRRLSQLDRLTRRASLVETVSDPVDPARIEDTMVSLGLEMRQTSAGPIWTSRMVDPVPVPERLPSFAGFFTHAGDADPAPGDLFFLDAETTGLAGGTGTLAFLVGVSWWTRQHLETHQFFLSSPAQEAALLAVLSELAQSFKVVVTFNGASFDLPLLRTRALMNRASDPLGSLVSWDLLVPARRLWGRKLVNCRQQTLEESICGLSARVGDIDGSRIPATWFEFLAGGEPGLLDRVLHHNHLDMLGMAHLFKDVAVRASLIAQPERVAVSGLDWYEAWSLGRICERLKDVASSVIWLRRAVESITTSKTGISTFPDPRFLADAIRILKRSGDWPLVENLIVLGLGHSPSTEWLHREAAILFERRLVNLEKALAHARLCGEDGRVERLQRKLAEVSN
ncbi:MAG: ribonuclease H-like domain-containing protein [Gemmatimonadales bacterium]|nr:ribonuclease H-like domain-containing protein [Gemmatimonadales bacterium]